MLRPNQLILHYGTVSMSTCVNKIYDNISPDLLHVILKCDYTTEATWKSLEALFQYNKASRATHLKEDLTNATFEDFNSIDTYCNYLRYLAHRLADVDAPTTNSRLVYASPDLCRKLLVLPSPLSKTKNNYCPLRVVT